MPIVGFNFEKVLVERRAGSTDPLKVNSDINIKSIEEEKMKVGKSEELVKFNFEYKINYEKVGEVELKGHVLYLDEPKKIKEILHEWNKNKNIPPDVAGQVINTILFRCNIKSLGLEQDVNLPPHLRLPRLSPVKDPKEYIG